MAALAALGIGFLFGSFPSGLVLARVFGRDIRKLGSGNIGAANVARSMGMKAGALVAILDIAKGVLPIAIGMRWDLGQSSLALIGLAAVLGHDFSPFLHFRGGKGVATTLGVALALAPSAGLLAVVVWAFTLLVSGYSSLASLLALVLLPLLMLLTGQSPAYAFMAVALFAVGTVKHWENIVRLANGTERSFKHRRSSDDS